MKGRAEYETNIGEKELFEGVSASSLFPWATRKGKGRGMIIAERGEGKTFLCRKLAEEIPSSIYALDKNSLDYVSMQDISSPRIVFVDDVHYLLGVMRLGILENNKIRDEKEVLQILKNLEAEAKEAEAKIVYVADCGPLGLQLNFQDRKYRKQFLWMLRGCISTTDDKSLFYEYFGKFYRKTGNVYNFRQEITEETSVNIKREFGMRDLPLLIPHLFKYYEYSRQYSMLISRRDVPSDLRLVTSLDKPEKVISPAYRSVWLDNKIWPDGILSDKLGRPTPLASIRELKVLNDEFGKVDRESLGMTSVGEQRGEEYHYTIDEVSKILKTIHDKYIKIAGRAMLPLARALLLANDEREFSATFVRYNLANE